MKWPVQGTSTVPIVSAHFRSLLHRPKSHLVQAHPSFRRGSEDARYVIVAGVSRLAANQRQRQQVDQQAVQVSHRYRSLICSIHKENLVGVASVKVIIYFQMRFLLYDRVVYVFIVYPIPNFTKIQPLLLELSCSQIAVKTVGLRCQKWPSLKRFYTDGSDSSHRRRHTDTPKVAPMYNNGLLGTHTSLHPKRRLDRFIHFAALSDALQHAHRAYVGWRRGVVVSRVRRRNEVIARRAPLVGLLGWVTVFGRVYHLGM